MFIMEQILQLLNCLFNKFFLVLVGFFLSLKEYV